MIYFSGVLLWISLGSVEIKPAREQAGRKSTGRRFVYLLCLKNSTWRRRFSASSRVLYGPPRFLPFFSETTLYPPFTFLIIRYPPAPILRQRWLGSIPSLLYVRSRRRRKEGLQAPSVSVAIRIISRRSDHYNVKRIAPCKCRRRARQEQLIGLAPQPSI